MSINARQIQKGIARLLELSADLQIQRRQTPKDSLVFHRLTGAIAAYGKALALLTALQQREEFYAIVSERCDESLAAVPVQ